MADEYGFEEEKNEPDMEYEEEFSPKEEITEVPKKETKEFKIVSAEEIGNKVDIKIIDALKKVKDPEIDMDIWNLGLIYDMNVEDQNVNIVMTFTSPMCPFGPKIVFRLQIFSTLSYIHMRSSIFNAQLI